MRLSDFLDPESIRTNVAASNKRALLHQLSVFAGQGLGLDPAAILSVVAERERLGSTGFGNGVAIPHGKIAGLDRMRGFVMQLAKPVDYQAIDGNPVDLAFLLLSPPGSGAEHLKALAVISRTIRDRLMLDKLRGARSRDALAAVLLGAEERDAA